MNYHNSIGSLFVKIISFVFISILHRTIDASEIVTEKSNKKTTKSIQTTRIIWYEDFNNLSNGTDFHAGQAGWDGEIDDAEASFGVHNNRYRGQNLDKKVQWKSESINIKFYENVSVSINLDSEGPLEDDQDYVKTYYRLDGGPKILLNNGNQVGGFSATTATVSGLSGERLEIIIKMLNTASNENYYFDNVIVTAEEGELPENLVYTETFNGLPDFTKTSDNWSLDISNTTIGSNGYFEVRQDRLLGRNVDGKVIWESAEIDISPYSAVNISADLYGYGKFENNEDYLRFYYQLDGGNKVLIAGIEGEASDPITALKEGVSGNTLVLIAKLFNDTNNERYVFDNVIVKSESAPLMITNIIGGNLTCSNPNPFLDVETNFSDVTYFWSGPNGFMSNEKSPEITEAGNYEITVTKGVETDASTITVMDDRNLPDITVSSDGALTTSNPSVRLTASSETPDVSFTWEGFAQGINPISVSQPGLYIVTVINDITGCEAKDSVEVLAFDNVIWYEDFNNLSNGTDFHAGQAGWDGEIDDAEASFGVHNNRYRGQNLDKKVQWKSESINIKFYENVSISVNLDSEGPLEDDQDYVKAYYRLDGGPKILLNNGNQVGGFSATTATVSGLSGERLEIIIKMLNTASNENYYFDNVIVTAEEGELPENLVYTETFNGLPDFTKTSDKWSLDISNTTIGSNGYFEVRQDRLLGRNVDGKVIWESAEIDISAYSAVNISADLYGYGKFENNEDYLRFYYQLDGGNKVLIAGIEGEASDPITALKEGVSGNTLVLIAKLFNDTNNERYVFDNVFVESSISNIPLSITTVRGGTLNCIDSTVVLDVTTNLNGVDYLWTGPDGFTSSDKNPVVDKSGSYDITVSIGTESANTTVTVTDDQSNPNVSTSSDGIITCSNTSVELTAQSSDDDISFTWSGFAAGTNPVSVSSPGNYVVTATDTVNGCSAQTSVNVGVDITEPDVSASSDGIITCSNTSVELTAVSGDSDISFIWTGFTAGTNPVSVSSPGDYVVTATDTVNGCSAQTSVNVGVDITEPDVSASSDGIITCLNTSVELTAVSGDSDISFTWTGFAAGTNPVSVSAPGDYVVTATDTVNGCSAQTSVNVGVDITEPDVSASSDGIITCLNTSVELTAVSGDSDISFTWTGFVAGTNPVSVSAPGDYVVTATDTVNGCSAQTSVNVGVDITEPDVSASADGIITCSNTSVELTAVSGDSDISFTWSGFAAGTNPVSVSAPGDYVVTATNAVNGCSAQTSVNVGVDITEPNVSASADGIITCSNTSVELIAQSSDDDISFTWIGFTAGTNPVSVSSPGDYVVTATDTVNGCSAQTSVNVGVDITEPNVSASADGIITCSNTSVELIAQSSDDDISFTWTGFTAGTNPVSVSAPGDYVVTATDTVNGCSAQTSVNVGVDITEPNVSASSDGIITCSNTSVELIAQSSDDDISFTWTGFTAGTNPASVSAPGDYVVTATDTVNGCSAQTTVNVGVDITEPNVSASSDGIITCSNTSVELIAQSSDDDISFTWSGFAAGTNPVSVSAPGDYVVTATDTVNGCSAQTSVNVGVDITEPDVSASADGIITCSNTSVELTAVSGDSDISFTWSGFAAGTNPVSVSSPGDYVVTATDTVNGCSAQTSVNVGVDITEPDVSASSDGIITCLNTSVELTAVSGDSDISFTWTGFVAGTNPVSVSAPGDYVVTATDTVNGCSAQTSVNVGVDITEPDVSASADGIITCSNTSVELTAVSGDSDISFTWSGFTAGTNPVSVSSPGNYVVTATDTVNGCSAQTTVNVGVDITEPDVSASSDGIITCLNTSVELTAVSGDSDISFTWSGFAAGNNPVSVSSPGDYVVTATDTVNGCSAQTSVNVGVDITEPDVSASAAGIITCSNTSVELTAVSADSDISFTWSGFAAGTNPVSVSAPGDYVVMATDTLNGCSAQTTVNVGVDITEPDVSASSDGIITCSNTSVELTAQSSDDDISFTWSGFTAGTNPVSVSSPGDYVVTATNAVNGCSAQTTVNVGVDITEPDVSASSDGIITCSNTSVELTAQSSDDDISFTWSGFAAGTNPVSVSALGDYVVTATNTVNGCSAQTSVNVGVDITEPDVSASADGIITCSNTSVELTAVSGDSDISFIWTGFTAGTNPVSVSAPGDYVVTATNAVNGCSAQTSVNVGVDITEPDVSASADGIITCSNTSVELTAVSGDSDISFTWTGFTAGTNPVSVSAPGDYVVTATNTVNGCSAQTSVNVGVDITEPDVSASADGIITCSNTSVELTAVSGDSDISFTWTDFTAGTNPVSVSSPGDYVVTATNTVNGCSAQTTVNVGADITEPDVSVSGGTLTCSNPIVTLEASSNAQGIIFTWTNFSQGENPIDVFVPDNYSVTAQSTLNGCFNELTVNVGIDIAEPTCDINIANNTGVAELEEHNVSTVFLPVNAYLWTISSTNANWQLVSGEASSNLTYQAGDVGSEATIEVIVTDNNNGCFTSCDVDVISVGAANVRTASVALTDPKVNELHVDIYPNPSHDIVSIDFISEKKQMITVEIYTMSGTKIATLYDEVIEAEFTHQAVFNERKLLSSGVYQVVIRTEENEVVNKLIITK